MTSCTLTILLALIAEFDVTTQGKKLFLATAPFDTLESAREICMSKGGDLVTVASRAENEKIIAQINQAVRDRYQGLDPPLNLPAVWLGAFLPDNVYESGTSNFIWTSTGKPISDAVWADGGVLDYQPGAKLCTTMQLSQDGGTQGQWSTAPCNSRAGVFCQKGELFCCWQP